MNKIEMESEKPIENKECDKLNRSRFAINIAKKIVNYKQKDSITIGLIGTWGCGKTSIINMIKQEVQEINIDKPIIVDFNPWYFSGRKQLISDFFKILSENIGYGTSSELKNLGDDLKKYSKVLKPLALIPQLSFIVEGITKVAEVTGEAVTSYCEQESCDVGKLKEKINSQLSHLESKIVVIIDEIDRLEDENIKEIFQLVRALGDFDNIIYLLSFDREKVCKVFSGGEEYIDKIINVPIYVPETSAETINMYFRDELNKIFKNRKDIDFDYWHLINKTLFKNNFNNLREVNRFLNIVKFDSDDMVKDLNVVDYLTITYLKIFENDIYKFIISNKELLLNTYGKDTINKKIKELLIDKHVINRNVEAEKLIDIIFYKINFKSSRRGVRNKKCFDSYFQYNLHEDIFTYKKIEQYAKLSSKSEFEEQIDKLSKDDLGVLFNNLGDIVKKIDSEQCYFFLEVLLKKVRDLKKDSYDFKEKATQNMAFEGLKEIVNKLDNNEKIINIIKNINIDKSYSINNLFMFLVVIKQHFNDESVSEKLLNIVKTYIEQNGYCKDILQCLDMSDILGFDVKQYKKKVVEDLGIIKYLKAYITKIYGREHPIYGADGEVEQEEIDVIIKADVVRYIGEDYIQNKIRELDSDEKNRGNYVIRKFNNAYTEDDLNNFYGIEQ